jgi:hypothetical protein
MAWVSAETCWAGIEADLRYRETKESVANEVRLGGLAARNVALIKEKFSGTAGRRGAWPGFRGFRPPAIAAPSTNSGAPDAHRFQYLAVPPARIEILHAASEWRGTCAVRKNVWLLTY